MKSELQQKLEQLALKRSVPFCYNDYIECPSGQCHKCGSDDLMRMVPGVGCEYGTDWIIKHVLETELEPVDMDAAFEEFVRECYPETTKIGWMDLDTVAAMKEMDPVFWRCALGDWESHQVDEETIITFDYSSYYWASEIEALCINHP